MSVTIDPRRARRALDVLTERIPSHHVGAQLYVSLRGEPVIDDAVGDAREGGPRLTTDHLMLWFSSTKPLTAVAIGQLWERGLLDLDHPVVRFMPEFGRHGKEVVTIRHVLTHTGGFRKVPGAIRFQPWEDQVRAVCEAELEWRPGAMAGYHPSSGWVALGEIVRRIDGRRIDDYVRREVCEPLGMKDTWLGIPAERQAELDDRIAHVYPRHDEAQYQVGAWNSSKGVAMISPGGSGRGPARDLGRFYECLLRGGEPVLRPQTVEALTASHRVGRFDHTFRLPVPWGLGFVKYGLRERAPIGSQRSFGHGGHSSSIGWADPETGLVVACVTNGLPGAVDNEKRMLAVFAAIFDACQGLPVPEDDARPGPGPIILGRNA